MHFHFAGKRVTQIEFYEEKMYLNVFGLLVS